MLTCNFPVTGSSHIVNSCILHMSVLLESSVEFCAVYGPTVNHIGQSSHKIMQGSDIVALSLRTYIDLSAL